MDPPRPQERALARPQHAVRRSVRSTVQSVCEPSEEETYFLTLGSQLRPARALGVIPLNYVSTLFHLNITILSHIQVTLISL